MKKEFREALLDSPVITAVKDEEGLAKCIDCESSIVFILYGDICTLPAIVSQIKAEGKIAIVHIDLINGLSSKEIAVDFIKQYTDADGIISTKPSLIKRAKELDLCSILRVFVIDSLALEGLEKQLKQVRPDIVEVLPALMPKVIGKISKTISVPVIAGGLASCKEDIIEILDAGATSVSTSNMDLWML